MSIKSEMIARLEAALSPVSIDLRNDSHHHAGHMGDDGSGESHWHLTLVSTAFAGKTRVAQHRMVHAALGADIMGSIHALGLELSTPD